MTGGVTILFDRRRGPRRNARPGEAKTRRHGRLDGAQATAPPSRGGAKKKGERTEQGAARDCLRSDFGRFCRLLLGGIDRLSILLLVLLNAGSSLFDRNTLSAGDRLGGALARLLGLLLVTRKGGPHRSDSRIAQGCRIVAARSTAEGLLDRGEGIVHPGGKRGAAACAAV